MKRGKRSQLGHCKNNNKNLKKKKRKETAVSFYFSAVIFQFFLIAELKYQFVSQAL